MEMEDWCSQMGYIIGHFRNINQLNDKDWKSWGKQFLLMSALSPLTPPDPDSFHDWVEYGERLVDAMGGRIWVESPGLGKGATFLFTIPASS